MEVGIAGKNLSFDFRDLAAAALDSRKLLPAFRRDLIERSSITIERGMLPRQQLPALHYDVNIPRIKLHTIADALRHFRCGQRGPGAEEGVIDQLAVLGVIENRTSHTLDWLLGAVNRFGVLVPILDLPQRTLFAIAIPMPGRPHGVHKRAISLTIARNDGGPAAVLRGTLVCALACALVCALLCFHACKISQRRSSGQSVLALEVPIPIVGAHAPILP